MYCPLALPAMTFAIAKKKRFFSFRRNIGLAIFTSDIVVIRSYARDAFDVMFFQQ